MRNNKTIKFNMRIRMNLISCTIHAISITFQNAFFRIYHTNHTTIMIIIS